MELSAWIQLMIGIPLVGFLISILIPESKENLLSRIAFYTAGLNLLSVLVFLVFWGIGGFQSLNLKEFILLKTTHFEFLVDFFFDRVGAVYVVIGAMLTFLITFYSRYYLHRESGYKRFFNTVLFFYLGFNITVLAGNFETLFVGWEILGISSFLLVAFYRENLLPTRNSIKVFSIYRIGDVGLILAMWASHHLWHENITFIKLNNAELVSEHLAGHSGIGIFIAMMLLLAAAAKSAQFPFSSWLPRAMEGPTPSSAIFYGSLSVHLGVFLLLRTFPFWENQITVRVLIGLMGLTTALVSTMIARVQTSVKTQIGYASLTQIGIMFIEVAAGLEVLALIHFAGNAFLRTYQLLVSPSVVSYLIREQFYGFEPKAMKTRNGWMEKMRISMYVWSLKEWNLDRFINQFVFSPMKKLGHKLDFLSYKTVLYYFIPSYLVGVTLLLIGYKIPEYLHSILPLVFAFVALLMVMKSFTERKSARLSWTLLVMNHFWMALAIAENELTTRLELVIYLSGVVFFGLSGLLIISWMNRKLQQSGLYEYQGYVREYPGLAFLFLLSVLGLMGFPISPTFVGEDLLFSHIQEDQYLLAFFAALAFVMEGIAAVRIFARLFLGTKRPVPETLFGITKGLSNGNSKSKRSIKSSLS
ncbi:NADH-ubiquinone oxidoreductase (complex I) subunit 5 [Algoriphagus boseongensis]|uniref:NADH-ubiquinone oxidoreductase (Complex I) subunit 5 n=1 Tax=Algoriphagus boseongensis TaxID=1442587 RepID=A0A4R6T9N9_9BACT|nr:proton-conducting transporter membrane subunit [Algoriphagus boseongensis]TDQ18592.1 NADH-ubiquinone oxidoreductase (complex I) subunit 5 [Algoriphagus boseongensis]